MSTAPNRTRGMGPAAVALAVVALAALLTGSSSDWMRLVGEPAAWPQSDFQIVWAAGRGLEQGLDIHDPQVLDALGREAGRMPTPFSATLPLVSRLIAALTGDDFGLAYVGWLRVNGVLLALCVGLLAACLAAEGLGTALACMVSLAALTLNDATWMSLYYNQLNLFALAAVLAALGAGRSGRPVLEGVLLALAVLAKTSPVLLVLVAAFAGRWRTVAAAAVTCTVMLAASVAWNGLEIHQSYVERILPALAYAPDLPAGAFNNSLHSWNLAPNGFLSRAAAGGSWAAPAAWAVALAVGAVLFGAARRARGDVFAQYAMAVSASFLISSVTWPHHLVWTCVPLAWLACRAWSAATIRARRRGADALAAAALVVLFLPLGSIGSESGALAAKGLACAALFGVVARAALTRA